MQRLPIILASVALAMALAFGWTSTMAQDDGQLPIVDWPCESRFVAAALVRDEAALVTWPCESRFIALLPMAAGGEGAPMQFDWPCESRFVTTALVLDEAALVTWPCESRFALFEPIATTEHGLIALVDWPSELRFADLTSATVIEPAAPVEDASRVDANKRIYHDVLTKFFANGDAQPLFDHYPRVIAETRLSEWTDWQHAFADLQPSLDFQIAEGDRVLSCWTFQGIHRGEFMGVAPTGKPVIFQVLYTARLIDGVVVEEIGQMELRPLLEQLELELAPRQSL